jgi:predicted porin
MQKKLIALAVAGLVAAPAFAATSNVDVGGTMNLSVDYIDADVAGNGSNVNVSSNSSNIFFKGSEDLGNGLKGIWQIQTYFSAGGTGNADTGVAGESTKDGVSSGNTYVGLAGGFGTALIGKHEAPAKLIGRSVDLFGDQLGDNRNFTAKPAGQSNGWDLRPNNVIAYISPNFSGFSGAIAYVTNVTESDSTNDNSIDAWSGSAKYENGPLMLGLGYQVHNLSETNPANEDENMWRLAASYNLGDLRLVGLYQQAADMNGTTNNDVKTWGVGAAYKMGNMTFKGQYYSADDRDNAANTSGEMYAIGLDYALSKRTTVQFSYAATDNDSGVEYSAFGGGHGDNVCGDGGVTCGDPSGFGINVKHAF